MHDDLGVRRGDAIDLTILKLFLEDRSLFNAHADFQLVSRQVLQEKKRR